MTILDRLAEMTTKVFLHNRDAVERNIIRAFLDAIKLHTKHSQSVVSRVSNQESEIDEAMGIGQLGNEFEILGKIRRSIFQGGKDENSFFVVDSLARGFDSIEVDMRNGGFVDFYRSVVVEDDGRL